MSKSVIIVHVPYEHRGGEDAHVDMLVKAYEQLGYDVSLFPPDRQSPSAGRLKNAIASLAFLPGARDGELPALEELWLRQNQALLHLHNIYPVLGPRLLKWIESKGARAVMTVHNHRFYCTNGLALRDGRICKECKPSASYTRPIKYNCNDDLKKSAYYAAAITKTRNENLFDKAIKKFIAPSPYIRDELISIGFATDRISHILNPIATSTEASGSAHAVDVLFAGRLSQEKGLGFLIETVRLQPHTSFGIIGTGPLEPLVKEMEHSLPNLKHFGAQPHSTVLEFIRKARIGVLPSICNEILPTFVLENFAQGKRCVVPDLESTRWLATGDFPGHLAITHDPHDLSRAVKSALNAAPIAAAQRSKLQAMLGFDRFCTELKAIIEAIPD